MHSFVMWLGGGACSRVIGLVGATVAQAWSNVVERCRRCDAIAGSSNDEWWVTEERTCGVLGEELSRQDEKDGHPCAYKCCSIWFATIQSAQASQTSHTFG